MLRWNQNLEPSGPMQLANVYLRFQLPFEILAGLPANKRSVSVSTSEETNVDLGSMVIDIDEKARKSRAPPLEHTTETDFRSYVGTWKIEEEEATPTSEASVEALANSLEDLMSKTLATTGRKKNLTYLDRHQKLEKQRESPSKTESSNFETKITQPFVNGVLRTCLDVFSEEFKAYVENEAGETLSASAKSEFIRAASLYLYTEAKVDANDATQHPNAIESKNQHHGNPNSAFFQRGTPVDKKESIAFDATAREIGMLISVEAKRVLDKEHANTALLECERDLVSQTFQVASTRMRPGYSIITDGVDWYFLRIHWFYEYKSGKWFRRIAMSKTITPSPEDWKELSRWLLFVFHESLHNQELPTGMADNVVGFTVSESWSNFLVRQLKRQKREKSTLEISHIFREGRRFIVSQWESPGAAENGRRLILKQVAPMMNANRRHELMEYYNNELTVLRELASTGGGGIVAIAPSMPSLGDCLWLEYAGDPLEKLDICGKRGRQLARIVKTDIWKKALPALNKIEISHGDIHQANVLVCLREGQGRAVLIDFESARRYGSDFNKSPIRLFRFQRAGPDVDEIAVMALLTCLWNPQIVDFGGIGKMFTKLKEGRDKTRRFVQESIL